MYPIKIRMGFFLGGILFLIFSGTPLEIVSGESQTVNNGRDIDGKGIVTSLKKGLKNREFSFLHNYSTPKNEIWWGHCRSDSGFRLNTEEIIFALSKELSQKSIEVTDSVQGGYQFIVETTGWEEERPFWYFHFMLKDKKWIINTICSFPTREDAFKEMIKEQMELK